MNLFKSKPNQYFEAWGSGLQWLKEHPYQASPMWICSQSLSAIEYNGNNAQPATYNELVLPDNLLPMNWNAYLKDSASILEDYKSGKKKIPTATH